MRRLFLLTIVFLGWSLGLAGQRSDQIWVIAHRGASTEAPENTLAAIDAAVKIGCQVVEVDVRLSRDRQAVLIHDSTVDRTTDGRGRVDQLTWAELRELNAGARFAKPSSARVPLLKEAIDLVRDRAMLYLDIKVTELEPIVSVVRGARFSNSVFYRVYRPGDVDRLRKLDPDARVIIDVDQFGSLPGAVDLVLARHPDTILSVGLDAWSRQTEDKVKKGSSRWFLNVLGRQDSESELRRAIDLRPTGIVTDSPRLLLKMLQ